MKYTILVFSFLIMSNFSFAQDPAKSNLNLLLTSNFYSEYELPVKRKVLSLKNKGIISKINPVTYISAGLLFVYQRLISEQIQAECMYVTSCSSYTKFQIEKNGFRGFLLGINQLNNCGPFALYDYPSCKISPENRIINTINRIGK